MTGSAIAQAVPLILSPIATRLYEPKEYGILGLYMSLVAMGSVVVSSQYTQAILLPRKRADVVNLLGLSALITIAVTAAVAVVLATAPGVIPHIVGKDGYSTYLLLAPISIALGGLSTALQSWNSRHRRYRRISTARVVGTLGASGVQIGVGLVYPTALGLIAGAIAGSTVTAVYLAYAFYREDSSCVRLLSRARMGRLLREKRNFLLYVLPADMINTFTNQWPTLLLTRLAGPVAVGHYAMTQRVTGIPSSLLGGSIIEVFRQRAVAEYNELGHCRTVFRQTFGMLALLATPAMVVLLGFGPDLFAFVFGDRWRDAGVYAQVLSVMMYLRFVVSPLTYVYYIVGRQKEDFALHLLMIGSTALAMLGSYRLFQTAFAVIVAFSVNYSLIYVIYLIRSYELAGGRAVQRTDALTLADHTR